MCRPLKHKFGIIAENLRGITLMWRPVHPAGKKLRRPRLIADRVQVSREEKKMRILKTSSVLIGLSLLSACATYPTGPSIMAMPGQGKSFDQFQLDDNYCRNYAQNQIGGVNANQNATNSAVESAAVGTLVGAAAGALIGGNHQGAGVGAGAGLLVGSMAGAGAANSSGRMTQRSYDQAYTQCMYAKGEKVPVYGNVQQRPVYAAPPPPRYYTAPPPPPPGW
jgi:outer membrane lipoprotein SlyB